MAHRDDRYDEYDEYDDRGADYEDERPYDDSEVMDHRGALVLTTDPRRMDAAQIHRYLSEESYWAEGIPRDVVERSLANSLCVGVFDGDVQVGLTRVITDYATYAYLCDVYVLEAYRQRGIGHWMLEAIDIHPDLQNLRRWSLITRDAHQIQPLVPALKSWWMKIHVPANFIGYGTFSLAAMVGFAYLVKQHGQTTSWLRLMPLFVLGVLLAVEPMVFRTDGLSATWMVYFGIGIVIVGTILLFRRPIAARLPSFEVLAARMYGYV